MLQVYHRYFEQGSTLAEELFPRDHPLRGAGLKLQRARYLSEEIKWQVDTFLQEKPFQTEPGPYDGKRGCHTLRVTKATPAPDVLSPMVGDFFHNLRSIFDHIASGLVEQGGGKRSDGNFPIIRDPDWFEEAANKNLRSVSQEARGFIEAMQPYRGGENKKLLMIRDLNNLDKHEDILLVGTALQQINGQIRDGKTAININVKGGNERLDGVFTINLDPDPKYFQIKAGSLIALGPAPKEQDAPVEVTFGLVLGGEHCFAGRPVIKTLDECLTFTERNLGEFAEAFFPTT